VIDSNVFVAASDQALFTCVLEREESADENDLDATRELVGAVFALASDWLEPLGIATRLECCDLENALPIGRPPLPHWFARVVSIDPAIAVSPGFSNAIEEVVATLDVDAVERWISRSLAQSCEGNAAIAFAEMIWTVVRARLPAAQVAVHDSGGPIRPVLESTGETVWAVGPMRAWNVGAPVHVRATNDHGITAITLGLLWDVWATHPASRALVDAGIARVLARGSGWTVTRALP
jgi:hypothetical protein